MSSLSHADIALIAVALVGCLVIGVAISRYIDPAWVIGIGICLSVFSGNWRYLGSPIGFDRLIVLAGCAGVLLEARRTRALDIRWGPPHFLLLALSLYAIGSALWIGTLTNSEDFFGLLEKLGIVPFVLFAFAPAAFATDRQRKILLGLLLALGAYLGLTSLFETLGLKPLVLPPYISNPSIGIHPERARGPFLEAAPNGEALFTSMVAAVLAMVTFERRWVRVAAAAIIVVCGIGIIGTLTRQVWVAAAVSVVVTLVVVPRLRRYLVPVLVVSAVGVGVVFLAAPGLRDSAAKRADSERPVWDRLNSNRAALSMLESRPLLGFGWGAFPRVSDDYYAQSPNYPLTTVGRVHNVILSNGAELGLVGLALWLGALGVAIFTALTRRGPPSLEWWKIGLIPVALSWLIVINLAPFGYAFTGYLLWTWIGVAYGGRDVGVLLPPVVRDPLPAVAVPTQAAATSSRTDSASDPDPEPVSERVAASAPTALAVVGFGSGGGSPDIPGALGAAIAMAVPALQARPDGQADRFDGLRVAYLCSRYPWLSHTFVMREVAGLRELGVDVRTFCVHRTPEEELRSTADRAEWTTTIPLVDRARSRRALRSLSAPTATSSARRMVANFAQAGTGEARLKRVAYVGEALVLRREMQRLGLRHVHVHFANAAADVAMEAVRIGEAADGPGSWSWSFTLHGPSDFLDVDRGRLVEKARSASFVSCISEYARDRLASIAGPEVAGKCHVVRCTVDPGRWTASSTPDQDTPLRILHVGRLASVKRQDRLVRAVVDLAHEGVAVRCTIAGAGPEQERLRGLVHDAALPWTSSIELVGPVGADDIKELYEASDVFCLPSDAEGVPVVLMEAMAMGRPVVATKVAGVPELVADGESGMLVKPGDHEALVSALRRLADDPRLRVSMGEAGRERVEREFSTPLNARRMATVLREIIE